MPAAAPGLAALALLPLLLGGCQTMLIKQMQAAPVENRLYLHKGFKAGDQALYQAMDGAMHVKLEITSVRPGTVEAALSWPKVPARLGFMKSMVRRMTLDEKGEVRSAHIEDRSGGRHPLLVAGPEDPNYIGELKEADFEKGEPMKTPAGTYRVRRVLMWEMELRNPVVSQRVTSALFLDPSVRFGLVRRTDVYEQTLPLLELYQKALSLSKAGGSALFLYDYLLERAKGTKTWEMELLSEK